MEIKNESFKPNLIFIKDTNKNNKFSQQIRKMRSETVFNIGESAKIGADFIQQLIKSN